MILTFDAEAYDRWYESGYGARAADAELAALLRLLPPPPARLLDVGCGTGFFAQKLAARGYTVFCVDIAPEMAALAATKDGVSGRVVLGDALALPFRSRCFDCALFVTSLEFVGDPCRALGEAARCAEKIVAVVLKRFSARVVRLWLKRLLLGRRFAELEAARMTPSSLAACARRAGLEINEMLFPLAPLGIGLLAPVFAARLVPHSTNQNP